MTVIVDTKDLREQILNLNRRITILESLLNGVPITTARIADAAITTAKIEDASITNAKIDSFTFDKGVGGDLTLGGTANGNGILKIKDASDNIIVQGDNEGSHYYNTSGDELVKVDEVGVHIYDTSGNELVLLNEDGLKVNDGYAVIENRDGTEIVDDYGLISAANFPFSSVAGSGTQNTTSTSNQDITGLTITFSLDRAQQVYVAWGVRGYIQGGDLSDTTSRSLAARLNVDGSGSGPTTTIPPIQHQDDFDTPGTVVTYQADTASQTILSLSSGSHTVKLQFRTTNGSYTANVDRAACYLTIFRLGA